MDKKPTLVIPPEIRTYLEGLIQEANVPVFDEKLREDLIQYLFERLDKYLAAKIVENMTPEDTESFIQMNKDKKPQEEIQAFVNSHMKEPQEVFTKAFIDFRDFFLTGQNAQQEIAQSTQ